jgi:hypothetical protein
MDSVGAHDHIGFDAAAVFRRHDDTIGLVAQGCNAGLRPQPIGRDAARQNCLQVRAMDEKVRRAKEFVVDAFDRASIELLSRFPVPSGERFWYGRHANHGLFESGSPEHVHGIGAELDAGSHFRTCRSLFTTRTSMPRGRSNPARARPPRPAPTTSTFISVPFGQNRVHGR